MYVIEYVKNTKTGTYAGTLTYSASIKGGSGVTIPSGGISGGPYSYNCASYSGEHTWQNHDVMDYSSVGDNVNTCIHFKSTSSTSGIGMFWLAPLYAIKIN